MTQTETQGKKTELFPTGASMLQKSKLDGVLGIEGSLYPAEKIDQLLSTVGDEQVGFIILRHSAVQDASLAHVQKIKGVKMINLAHTGIGNQGIALLAGHPTLEDLQLTGTPINDGVLEHLLALPALRTVTLYDTAVTEAVAAKIKEGLRAQARDTESVRVNAYYG